MDSSNTQKTRYITEPEMRQLLRKAYAQDPEASLLWQITQKLYDPDLLDKKGCRRPHPLLAWYAVLVVIALTAFLYAAFRS